LRTRNQRPKTIFAQNPGAAEACAPAPEIGIRRQALLYTFQNLCAKNNPVPQKITHTLPETIGTD
jgi:hypothetical protein